MDELDDKNRVPEEIAVELRWDDPTRSYYAIEIINRDWFFMMSSLCHSGGAVIYPRADGTKVCIVSAFINADDEGSFVALIQPEDDEDWS